MGAISVGGQSQLFVVEGPVVAVEGQSTWLVVGGQMIEV